MDFPYDLSQVFPAGSTLAENLVKIGADMLPQGLPKSSIPSSRHLSLMQQRISGLIDTMGAASASAQGLKSAITTGEKVRLHPEHSVYILIDPDSNGGLGSVVGLLKVGRKNLFLLDSNGEQNEVYPMCVLDFYVHELRQRSGCGKKLFEAMLEDTGMHPKDMAIDRPSPKLLAFLKKYYNLSVTVPQVNNYVVYEGFFSSNNNESSSSAAAGVKRPRIYMGKLQYV